MIVEYRPAAREEVLAAARWYLNDGGPRVAERFEQALSRSLALVAALPELGSPGPADSRLWPLKRFPYTLVYRAHGDVLTVIAVAHQRQAPAYWRAR